MESPEVKDPEITEKHQKEKLDIKSINPDFDKKKFFKKLLILSVAVFVVLSLLVAVVGYGSKPSNSLLESLDSVAKEPYPNLTPWPVNYDNGIYTLNSSGVKELIKLPSDYPERERVEKFEGDYVYTSSIKQLYRYSLISKKKEIIIDDDPGEKMMYVNFQIEFPYAYYSIGEYADSQTNWAFYTHNMQTKEKAHVADIKPGAWGYPKYLFQASDGSYVIDAISGDGCGRSHRIYRAKDKILTLVEMMQSGCGANYEEYIDHLKNIDSILGAHVIKSSYDTVYDLNLKYDVLYSENILTKVKQPIMDLKKYEDIQEIFYDPDSNNVVLRRKNKISIINLKTNSIEKEFDISDLSYTPYITLATNMFYFKHYDKYKSGRITGISSFNKNTGEIKNIISDYDLSKIYILGEYKDELLLTTNQ